MSPNGTKESVTFQTRKTTIVPPEVSGDYNFDDVSDITDLQSLCSAVASGRNLDSYDVNSDGVVDATDLQQHLAIVNTTFGDTDLNGAVDFEDFTRLSDAFGSGRRWSQGDFDCDRDVDFADFLTLSSNFGFVADDQIASVPEPNTSLLMIAAFCYLGLCRQRTH